MKRSTAFLLLLGVCYVIGLVIYATTTQMDGHNSIGMWLMVHQQTPALWAIDGVAAYALLLIMAYGGQAVRVEARRAQIEMLHSEHQVQMEALLTNMEKVGEINTVQEEELAVHAATITAQEETIRALTAQTASLQKEVTALQTEIDARQRAFAAEAQRLMEQAFRALSGQVDSQSRQLEAINVALQYHQSEIQQWRLGPATVDAAWASTGIARLAPGEHHAISPRTTDLNEATPDSQPADAPAPTPAELPAPVADAAPNSVPDETQPEVAMAVADEFTSVSDPPLPPTPVTENSPNIVIMEPIYFSLSPVEETVEDEVEEEVKEEVGEDVGNVFQVEPVAEEVGVDSLDDGPQKTDETATVADILEPPTPAAATESLLLAEAYAVVAEAAELQASPNVGEPQLSDNGVPLPLSQPPLRLTRWQRKL